MPRALKNPFIFHKVTGLLMLAILAGCASPNNPSSPDDAQLIALAEQLHAKGDDAGAANLYTRVLQHDPNNAALRREFGEMLEAHGDLNGAATQYRAALGLPAPEQYRTPEITSTDVDLLRDYGRVLIKLGHPELAQPVYAQALKADPGDVRSLDGLGVALDERGDHLEAQKIYKEALDDKPDDIATLANLGHSYALSGAYDDAIRLLEPHLNDKNATPAMRQNLAEAYAMNGMDADAERVMRYDLPPQQIKHNMAFYHAQRTHMGAGDALYADLGSFPTEEIAAAHVDEIKAKFPGDIDGLTIKSMAKVGSTGGTPAFTVRVTGFERTSTLRAFCLKLKKQKIACSARMDM
jgi:Flp pilus assembly protein TadD